MILTALHLALGVTDGELSLELVSQACSQGVRERDDLDWKSTLPLTLPAGKETGRDQQQDELAKDIAAMANGRGGLIIYGVAETTGNTASHIQSVGSPDESTLQNIRRVANNLIYPPVTGLTLRWLSADDIDESVLALTIDPSVESPHLVRPRRQPAGTGFWFAVPYRSGPDTEWMPEKMIEAAYRDRLANRRQRDHDLGQLHAELLATTASQAGGAWVIATARPEILLPLRPRSMDLDKSAAIFDRAWRSPLGHYLKSGVSAEFVLRDVPPRRGLRRFSQIGINNTRAIDGGRVRAIAELHLDGSVGIALTRGGFFGPNDSGDGSALATFDLDQAVLDLFILASQAAQDLQVASDYEVLVSVEPAVGSYFRRPDPMLGGHFRQFTEEDRIGAFQPVTGTFLIAQGSDTAVDSLVDVAEDAVNQTRTRSRLEPLRPQVPGKQ